MAIHGKAVLRHQPLEGLSATDTVGLVAQRRLDGFAGGEPEVERLLQALQGRAPGLDNGELGGAKRTRFQLIVEAPYS